ncbi:MAG: hypothetical protein B7Z80_19775 [Rhodospirillales bacterium 20-64-7]|nr:MAG: hypothetical protein B7Z80_19775 [Rhodospirillales bacterium 20-64-7]
MAVNGTTDKTTANVIELAYVNGKVWQENASDLWWGKTSPTAAWSPNAGSATSPLPAATTPTPTPTPTPPPPTSGTRDPSQIPFASNSIFNLPLGTGAQWISNAQLSSANVYVNTTISGWNENIYTSSASDPLVTITDTGAVDGTPQTFHVHIPVGAVPASGTDNTFSVDDTSTHTWYSFGAFQWTGTNTATVSTGSGESDYGSGLAVASSNWDEGVGTLRESDLQAGSINHMLRMELPTDMLMSYTNSVNQLAPYAWPQTQEDGFAINGNGGPPYTGTIPYGVTIGIPDTAIEPADVAANAGANMLWHALQNHGAMVRDSGGSGDTVIFQADQTVNGNDPLILGMNQFGAEIMAQTKILGNQGPNSVNGGGTPVVPLDPAPSDVPASVTTPTPAALTTNGTVLLAGANAAINDASGNTWTITSSGQVAINGVTDNSTSGVTELAYVNGEVWQENASNLWWGKTSPGGSWSPINGTSASPLPGTGSITQSQTGTTVSVSQVTVDLPASSKMLFVSGTGDTVNVSGGGQSVTDTGSGNTYVIPAAGHGADTFGSDVLKAGDTLDLRTALAATNWNGAASTLASYLSVTNSGQAAVLSIAPTAGGAGVAIATLNGASGTTLSGLLAHALT